MSTDLPSTARHSSRYVQANCLYIVATPLGCLDDISLRARDVLAHVDWIAAEDTRHSLRLLQHLDISKPLIALHEHNEQTAASKLVERIRQGESGALISDAGTPLISDPGYRLVSAAHQAKVQVSPIPGPCAAIAALSAAGLPTDRFTFAGFLPAKQQERRNQLDSLKQTTGSLLFYLSPHQLSKQLKDVSECLGADRPATLARELTKRHEQIVHGQLSELLAQLDNGIPIRGEFTLCVAGNSAPETSSHIEASKLMQALSAHLPPGKAASITANLTGVPRRELYQQSLDTTAS